MSVATGALIPRVLAPAKLRRIGQQRRLVTGLVITVVVTVLAIIGPWLAPYGENEIVGKPFTMEGSWLGTDYLGQDVWSRVLAGGGSILLISVLATALGMVLGIVIGVVAAYTGGWLDEAIMRLNDVALAFPQILLALLVLTAVDQPAWWMIVLLVGVSHAPRVARVARGVALGIVSRDFVHSAEALGESRLRVIMAEVLPNMNAPLLAEAGLRLTYSIGMVAGIGFLGFAANPGAADWGQMINENRLALLVQPWGVLAPVIVIGIFTVGTNLMADGIAQLAGRGD
jgi:peptide/nickel transport system permease protein